LIIIIDYLRLDANNNDSYIELQNCRIKSELEDQNY